ncbi:MAG: hypothetical protein N3A66_02795, partial [Planctomycetota bacterium]|nr:hypothetical protein [Planctomycetota bacterium]
MRKIKKWFIVSIASAFIVLAGAIALFWHHQQNQLRAECAHDLLTLAREKAGAIARWRKERLADAYVLAESPFLIKGVAEFLGDKNPTSRGYVRQRLESLCRRYNFADALVADAEGKVALSIANTHQVLDPDTLSAIQQACRDPGPQAIVSDLMHCASAGFPHITAIAAMRAMEDGPPFGFIALVANTEQHLQPILDMRPPMWKTCAIHIVRREESHLVDIFQQDKQISAEKQISKKSFSRLPAPEGESAFICSEYGDQCVFAALVPIPDTNWHLLCKVDKAEALSLWQMAST